VVATSPPAIVSQLRADELGLQTAIGLWDGSGPAPLVVVKLAIDRERLIRQIASSKQTAAAVVQLAPGEADDLAAERDMAKLGMGTPPPKGATETRPAPPAAKLLAWYQEAQNRFGIHWQLLAAINYIETSFCRVRDAGGTGAQGPMQFEPATWQQYGLGGDISDPHDAILGAANYLSANGGVTDARAALRAYNGSPIYIDAVLHYAHRMTRVPTAFFEYYAR
jgi:hypothetical protein